MEAKSEQTALHSPEGDETERTLMEFKVDYENGGNRDHLDQVSFLCKLAQAYEEKDDWGSRLRAHALYNSCSVRDSDKRDHWQKKAHQIQQEYWQEKLQNFTDHQRVTRMLKQQLEDIRGRGREQTDQLVNTFQSLNSEPEYLNCTKNQALHSTILRRIPELSTSINQDMIDFTESVVQEALRIVGHPKRKFCAVALGSMARGETTPYSDLEFLFLIDEKPDTPIEQFQRLAVTMYFLIGNLGETKLKYMAIPELMTWDDEKKKYVAHWFDDTCMSGYKIDGLGSWAGNIPTGGTPDQHNQFICTVEELAARYKTVLDNPHPEKSLKGDFSAMLANTVYISGEKSLHERFRSLIDSYQPNEDRRTATLKMLVKDAAHFNFLPDIDLTYKRILKSDIYRYPSILILNLKILHKIQGNNPWTIINLLQSESALTASAAESLRFSLCCALYIRLSTYFHHKSQDESISVLSSDADDNLYEGAWYVNPELLTHMFITLAPLKEAVGKITSDSKQVKVIDVEMTDRSSRDIVAEVKYHCSDYQGAFQVWSDQNPLESNAADTYIQQLYIRCAIECNKFEVAEKALLARVSSENRDSYDYSLLGALHLQQGHFEKAHDYCVKALELLDEHEDSDNNSIAGCHFSIGLTLSKQGRYYEALTEYKLSLAIRQKLLSDEDRVAIARVLNNIGSVLKQQGLIDEALAQWNESLNMYRRIYGDRDHINIAHMLSNIAAVMVDTGCYDAALAEWRKSLGIMRRLFGDRDHLGISFVLNNIGGVLRKQDRLEEALENHKECLAIRLRIYGDIEHEHIATSRNNIGATLRSLGIYDDAVLELRKSSSMLRSLYKDRNHIYVVSSLQSLGSVLMLLGRHEEALHVYSECSEMMSGLEIVGPHPAFADIHYGIGRCLQSRGMYEEAIAKYESSLTIWKELYKGSDQVYPHIATQHGQVGSALQSLGRYDEALVEFETSLNMFTKFYGDQPRSEVEKIKVHMQDIREAIEVRASNFQSTGVPEWLV